MNRAQGVEYVGPFERHAVTVNGWSVPLLEAHPMPGGLVTLSLDGRYALDLPLADAERVVPFIAHAIAIALGFAGHPNGDQEPKKLPHLRPRQMVGIDSLSADDD